MKPTVVIDCFPSSVSKFEKDYAIVTVDVVRATTSAITAVLAGRRCFAAADLEEAHLLRRSLGNALLAGELNGDVPPGFDLNNSPAQLAEPDCESRPIVLLSTSGTQLMCLASTHQAAYVACLRNYLATAEALIGQHAKVAVIGAGSRNEFREEDQMCCAWIAEELLNCGYSPENAVTEQIVKRWSGAPPEACLVSNSVKYLRRTNQLEDLDFVLTHINDVDSPFVISGREVAMAAPNSRLVPSAAQFDEVAA
jgi:2-phosphosulfolactate phosphatase